MKTCSVCHRNYEDSAANCVENHGYLITTRTDDRQKIGDYSLEVLLERSAAGDIYRATHKILDQPFIIKIIGVTAASAADRQHQTLSGEALAAAGIIHPNVARTFESGWLDDGGFYVVTEAIADQTLREHLQKFGTLSETESVIIARQIAEALEAAHRVGVIHRAINPANIMIEANVENRHSVKLVNFDFGAVAQQITADEISHIQPSINQLRYLSPEQAARQTVDARTDIFNLGIVLYEMLCGRSPFNMLIPSAIADRHIDEEPLAHLRYDVRALLTYLLKQSLQTSPAARLPSAAGFARQLRQLEQLVAPPLGMRRATPQIVTPQEDGFGTTAFDGNVPVPTTNESSNENRRNPNVSNNSEVITVPVNQLNTPVNNEGFDENTFNANKLPSDSPFRLEQKESSNNSFTSAPILVRRKDTDQVDSFISQPILVKKKQVFTSPLTAAPVIVEISNESDFPLLKNASNDADRNVDNPAEIYAVGIDKQEAPPHVPISGNSNELPVNSSKTFLTKRNQLFIGAALLALITISGLGIFLFNQLNRSPVTEQTAIEEIPISNTARTPSLNLGNVAVTSELETTETENSQLGASQKSSLPNFNRESQNQSQQDLPANDRAQTPNDSVTNQPARESLTERVEPEEKSSNGSEQAALESSLDQWVRATNARDVEQQMNYYAPKVNAYYRARNASPELVRAEKKRIFERASVVDIQTDKPEITLSRDGQNATMRFLKKYAIKEGQKSRNGEVIQELQWTKSGGIWKIVSERDVKVINR